ncbi:MAG: hypothetical protein FJ314_10910 [SAR202 cluster bacterium]|nr:hypothetical protein [SAR202 cluster bacterium]
MHRLLSTTEARSALYIDFEGTATEPPSLLGLLWVDDEGVAHVQRLVFDPALYRAAEATGRLVLPSLEAAWMRVLAHSVTEKRHIVAWSIREAEVLRESALPQPKKDAIESRMVNALPIARRWRRAFHPEVQLVPGPRGKADTLHNYASLTGYHIPALYGPGKTAARIRYVRDQLKRHGTFAAITPVAKRKWRILLRHNELDLKATRHVMIQVASEMQAARPMRAVA